MFGMINQGDNRMTKDTDDPRWVIAIRMKESGCRSKEMGVEFGVTPGRARQIYNKAVRIFKFREARSANNLVI
jgi:DNA-directed RNA polymerase sigma subunit (sigma70/sigma32)